MCKKAAMLHEFIEINRDEIIDRCRGKVSARSVPPPTAAEIEHGVPVFLGQLEEALRIGLSGNPEIGRIAVKHGRDHLLHKEDVHRFNRQGRRPGGRPPKETSKKRLRVR